MATATKICFIRDTVLENYLDTSNITNSYKHLQKQTGTTSCSDKNAQLSRQERRAWEEVVSQRLVENFTS